MNDNKEPIEIPSLHEVMNRKDDKDNFILTPLSYTDDYLEPFIGERTVRFHYYKQPLSVETPAPPKKTMLFVAARISSNAGTMQTAPFAFGFYAL